MIKNPTHLKLFLKPVELCWADPHSGSKPPAFAGWSRDSLKPAGAFSRAEMVNAIISYGWWSWWKKSGEPLEMFFQPWNPNGGCLHNYWWVCRNSEAWINNISNDFKVDVIIFCLPWKASDGKNGLNLWISWFFLVMTWYDSLHLDESKKTHTPLSHHSVTLQFRKTCPPTRWCHMCDLFIPDRENRSRFAICKRSGKLTIPTSYTVQNHLVVETDDDQSSKVSGVKMKIQHRQYDFWPIFE